MARVKTTKTRPTTKQAPATDKPLKLKKAPAVNPTPALRVSFEALSDLLGKELGTPEVHAVLATAGKITYSTTHISADEAGFEFSLGRSDEEETRPLIALHLSAGHSKKTRAFADLPPPFIFSDRASLIALAPPPHSGLPKAKSRMKGLVPLSIPVLQDTWKLGKREFIASYKDNYVSSYSLRA